MYKSYLDSFLFSIILSHITTEQRLIRIFVHGKQPWQKSLPQCLIANFSMKKYPYQLFFLPRSLECLKDPEYELKELKCDICPLNKK